MRYNKYCLTSTDPNHDSDEAFKVSEVLEIIKAWENFGFDWEAYGIACKSVVVDGFKSKVCDDALLASCERGKITTFPGCPKTLLKKLEKNY